LTFWKLGGVVISTGSLRAAVVIAATGYSGSGPNPNIALAGGKLREGVLVSGADFWRQAHMPQDWGTERLLNPRFVYGSNLMLRKKVVEEIGGYKENFRRAGEDVDISARIRAKGYNTFYEPAAKVTHVRRDTVHSVMATYWRWNWFEYDRMRFKSVLGRAVLIHLTNVLGLLRQDVRRKKYRLLWLDLVALFAMVYFDFRLFIKTMVFPKQQVISEETKG